MELVLTCILIASSDVSSKHFIVTDGYKIVSKQPTQVLRCKSKESRKLVVDASRPLRRFKIKE